MMIGSRGDKSRKVLAIVHMIITILYGDLSHKQMLFQRTWYLVQDIREKLILFHFILNISPN